LFDGILAGWGCVLPAGSWRGDPADAFDVIVPSLPGFGFPGPPTGFSDVNFWKVSDLWHTLMTETLGYEKYAAEGCDIGGMVSSQLGHKYADELYGIHIGSGLPLDFFTGHRAWDFARNRPLTDDQPADVRARIIELDHRSASDLAVYMLDGATLAHGLSDSPAGLLAWLLERWNAWSAGAPGATTAVTWSPFRDGGLRGQRLADRGVVHGAGGLEVAGQVVLWVASPCGALDVDLTAAVRVPQCHQDAQLVGDALELALVVDDRLAPILAHHTVHRRACGAAPSVVCCKATDFV